MFGATENQARRRAVPKMVPLLLSMAAHVILAMLLVRASPSLQSFQSGKMRARATGGNAGATKIVHLYLPPEGTSVRTAAVSVKRPGMRKADRGVPNLNLTGIKLSIQDDRDFQLLPVLRRYKGFFGLARTDQHNVITCLFRASDFQRVSARAPHPRDEYFAVRIVNPSLWPLGTELAQAIRAEEMLVFALFPRSFVNRLDRAIRQAVGPTDSIEFKITEAVICFSAAAPDGFRVEHVVAVPSPAQEKPPLQPGDRLQE